MNFTPIIHALALPPKTRVEQRVPEKLFAENDAPIVDAKPIKRTTDTPL